MEFDKGSKACLVACPTPPPFGPSNPGGAFIYEFINFLENYPFFSVWGGGRGRGCISCKGLICRAFEATENALIVKRHFCSREIAAVVTRLSCGCHFFFVKTPATLHCARATPRILQHTGEGRLGGSDCDRPGLRGLPHSGS